MLGRKLHPIPVKQAISNIDKSQYIEVSPGQFVSKQVYKQGNYCCCKSICKNFKD